MVAFRLDNILDGGLETGNLIEICGLSGSGKTQLVNTIALNAASEPHQIGTIYLDSKHDFSGIRLYNILTARNGSKTKCGQVMELIKAARIVDVAELIRALRDLLRNIEKFNNFKILIVDSMPALWFLYHGDDFRHGRDAFQVAIVGQYLYICFNSILGMVYLNQVTQMLRKLAVNHNKVVLLVNLVTRPDNELSGNLFFIVITFIITYCYPLNLKYFKRGIAPYSRIPRRLNFL